MTFPCYSRHNFGKILIQGRARIPTPISTFAEYCAEDDKTRQTALVKNVKHSSGRGGVGPIMRFRQTAKAACQQGQEFTGVEAELKELIASNALQRGRLTLLGDAFIGQWRKYDYQFKHVQGTKISLARLTIKVFPDLVIVSRAGDEIAVRLWLSERDILDKERDTFIYPMSEAKQPAQ